MKQHSLLGRTLTTQEAEIYLGGDTMNLFRQQLMLCLLDRLGGEITIPVAEVDATGQFTMSMQIDPVKGFTLKLGKKQ